MLWPLLTKFEPFFFFSEPEDLPEHGVTVVFVNLDNTKIELLYPLGEKSPIKGFLDKNANGGIHHVCIEVNDINEAVKDVKAKNIRCLSPEPRIGAHGKPVMFLHPKDCAGVLIELEQAWKSLKRLEKAWKSWKSLIEMPFVEKRI